MRVEIIYFLNHEMGKIPIAFDLLSPFSYIKEYEEIIHSPLLLPMDIPLSPIEVLLTSSYEKYHFIGRNFHIHRGRYPDNIITFSQGSNKLDFGSPVFSYESWVEISNHPFPKGMEFLFYSFIFPIIISNCDRGNFKKFIFKSILQQRNFSDNMEMYKISPFGIENRLEIMYSRNFSYKYFFPYGECSLIPSHGNEDDLFPITFFSPNKLLIKRYIRNLYEK